MGGKRARQSRARKGGRIELVFELVREESVINTAEESMFVSSLDSGELHTGVFLMFLMFLMFL